MIAKCASALIVIFVLILAITATAQVQKSNSNDSIGVLQQMTFGELSNKWWQWAYSLPGSHHPLTDTADCSTGQSGPVWFLGGRFCAYGATCDWQTVERSCQIPSGKALFFPLYNSDHSLIEDLPDPATGMVTESILRARVRADEDSVTSATATVDNKAVPVFRICSYGTTCMPFQAPLFPITLPQDNLMSAIGETVNLDGKTPIPDGATTMMVTGGYYAFVPSLSVGRHTVVLHTMAGGWGLDITYHLRVMP